MMAMTSTAASAATCLCSTRSTTPKPSLINSHPKSNQRLHLSAVFPQLSLTPLSPWSGLKHLGVSFRPNSSKLGKKGRCKGMVVYASLFGVGAPEALVIGVVALLVFGPKGLAEVARNLGKTLRAFQPTIRELQEVSRDVKSTLEKEIGLDDINTYNSKIMGPTSTPPSTTNTGESKTTTDPSKVIDLDDINTYNSKIMGTTSTPPSTTSTGESKTTTEPNGVPPINRAYTSEEYLKITEEQLKATATQNQEQSMPPAESQSLPQPPQDTVEETAVKTPPPQPAEGES